MQRPGGREFATLIAKSKWCDAGPGHAAAQREDGLCTLVMPAIDERSLIGETLFRGWIDRGNGIV